jgi:pyridoxine 5-phosphate synthase
MTKLSVNINKIATLRNARGGNVPNLLNVATDIQKFGARNHHTPRPDERHIRYQDARDLKAVVYTEFNIEGNPQHNLVWEMQTRAGNLFPTLLALSSADGIR